MIRLLYMLYLLLAGAFGGLVRGLVGFLKYQFAYKNIKFEPKYFALIMGLSALIGMAVSWAVANSGLKMTFVDQINPAIAFIVGYAGGDFVENLYKILLGKDTLYSLPAKKK